MNGNGFGMTRVSKDKVFIPAELPILPLRGTVAYPDLVMPLTWGVIVQYDLWTKRMPETR